MRTSERIGLASLAYQRAIANARADSTPTRWARLLTAARNLRTAKEDREREQARAHRRPAAVHGHGEPAVLAFPPPRTRPHRATPPEVLAEWKRSHALREWSRRLGEQSRALRAAVAALTSEALPPRGDG